METRDVGMDVDVVDTALTSRKRIKFEVELHGDTVCPWSYLGKKSLDSAIQTYAAKYPDDVFAIIWKPFILWPTAKVSAYDKRAPLVKMAGPARAPFVFERLASTAAEYDIHFNWDGLVGNSADSHKLIMLAYEMDQKLCKEQEQQEQQRREANISQSQPSPPPTPDSGLSEAQPPSQPTSILNQTQHAFLEALFYTTLTRGFDPSDRSFLISLALSMDPPLATYPSDLLAYLDSEDSTRKLGRGPGLELSRHQSIAHAEGRQPSPEHTKQHQEEVRDETKHDNERASKSSPPPPQHVINAVPSVIVQGRYRVGGMQKPEVYLRVFEKVREGYFSSL